jgi:bifunctional ADP-heptose synthase (sugar kinase/adenylyltransferase)
LSLGQRQLVEIAKALTTDLRVLILDEPNSALTHEESAHLFRVVRELREKGIAIVYVSDVIDTTGAGDAFTAALAVSLAEGHDLTSAIKFAGCNGALACTKYGVIPSLAARPEVDRLYSMHFSSVRSILEMLWYDFPVHPYPMRATS